MRPMPVPSRVAMMVQQANAQQTAQAITQPNAQAIAQPKTVVVKEMKTAICSGCMKEFKTSYQGTKDIKCPNCIKSEPEKKPEIKSEKKPEIKPDVRTYVKPATRHEIEPDVKTYVKPAIKSEKKPVKKGIVFNSNGFVGTQQQIDKYDWYIKLLNMEDDNFKTAMVAHLKQQV
jgi:hypothetical protein